MASAAELLDEVNAAISACLQSQQYTVRGRSNQRAQLAQLATLRRELMAEVGDAGLNGGAMASVCQVDRPS